MTLPRQQDFTIIQGDTFSYVERLSLEQVPYIYKAITAVTKASPVSITSATHGLKAGWRVAVVSVGGTRQLNAKNWPLRSTDFYKASITDSNTITLNDVNSASYSTYTSGGSLVYFTPLSLASCTARMTIRSTVSATTALATLVSGGAITLDDTEHTITVTLAAATTAAYTFTNAVYDFELVTAAGVVTKLLSGNVTLVKEVTR